ncbi:RNA annealing protein Yra1 [Penicillium chermesinum]|uniref:RNA annealing protein Yra1 n=1 Tax=Penicillium chermesinum TaxID=63820 RepID=A0A9W9TWR9_9EURO|nr:RNA annealing protein Yra1 [Penicillium chermesinum]KAJ5246445.1 RNA annealing protein Yra1 [Penicillium chermesinum]KAJ6144722.1 RNA annealing protein Yra1 [Penicillium chermesinum]
MSANLDKSLDDLVGSRRQARRRTNRRVTSKASTGGVKKSAKAPKAAAKVVHQTPVAAATSNKIYVSGLPVDVTEANIKEYFTKSAGSVKKVTLAYTQNGTSRGQAHIVFSKPGTAAKAAKELNGLLVDGRPMKIEVVYDASHAPAVAAPKPLTERIAPSKAQAKDKPKPATAKKAATNDGGNKRNAAGRPARGRKGQGRNAGRSHKTVEELDAEMADYFETNASTEANAAPAGAVQQANGNEDLGMAEISVCIPSSYPGVPTFTLTVIQ